MSKPRTRDPRRTIELTSLSSPGLAALLERAPVALWPFGAIEPHGPHAPLGTDTLISLGICRRAAVALVDVPAVVLPTLDFGITRFAAGFAGAVGITGTTLRAVVIDVVADLRAQGFRAVAIVNSHFEPAQVATLRSAARDAGALYFDLLRSSSVARLTDEFRSGACHAGSYETSLVLTDRPELIDEEARVALDPLPVNMAAAIRSGADSFEAMGMHQAYCGSPADATPEEGAATFTVLSQMLVNFILESA